MPEQNEVRTAPNPTASGSSTPATAPPRWRSGTGPAGRPSLGWTELGVAVAVYLVLSVPAVLLWSGSPARTAPEPWRCSR